MPLEGTTVAVNDAIYKAFNVRIDGSYLFDIATQMEF
jgi:hypothetical protein